VQVLAELWRLDESTIRRIFEAAPGVLRLGNDKRRSGKREYFTLRIPASVAEREYQRRVVALAQKKGSLGLWLICFLFGTIPISVPIGTRGRVF
jgi:hypothetical protein